MNFPRSRIHDLMRARLTGEAAWVVGAQLATVAIGLLAMRLMTELVPPAVFGNVVLVTGIVALLCGVGCLPSVTAGERLRAELARAGRLVELRKVLLARVDRSVLAGAALLVVAAMLLPERFSPGAFALIIAVPLLMVGARRELETHWLAAGRDHRRAGLWMASDTLARPLLAVCFVALWGASVEVVLLGFVVAAGLTNLFWIRSSPDCARVPRSVGVDHSLARRVRRFARPLIPVNLLEWFNGQGDRFIIAVILSTTEVGLYGAVYVVIHEAFRRMANVVARILRPVYFERVGRCDGRAHSVYAVWLTVVVLASVTGVTLLVLWHDAFAALLLAAEYRSAAVLMPWIGLGSAFCVLRGVIQQPLLAEERTTRLLTPKLIGFACGLVAIPVLTWQLGVEGAAMACPIYFGMEALAMTVAAKPWRHLPGRAELSGAFATLAAPHAPLRAQSSGERGKCGESA